jgi:hypothetical protein
MANFFDKAKTDIKNWRKPEVKSAPTVVEAAPAKPAVVPQGAQWSGQLTRPETGLPPGWTPIDLPADFTEVFGYEEPLQRREIPPEDFERGEKDIFLQVHMERNKGEAIDRMYSTEQRNAGQDFLAMREAEKSFENSLAYKASIAGQQKSATSINVNCGGGLSITYDQDGSAASVVLPNGSFGPIPRVALDNLISALQAFRAAGSGKSSSAYHPDLQSGGWGYATALRHGRLDDPR